MSAVARTHGATPTEMFGVQTDSCMGTAPFLVVQSSMQARVWRRTRDSQADLISSISADDAGGRDEDGRRQLNA